MTAPLPARVQRSFSRSFATYDGAAAPQAETAARLVSALIDAGAPGAFRTALELGCGTGHLTRLLRRAFAIRTLALNDIAPEARATAKASGADFLCGDAIEAAWPAAPGLIASASMIQWLHDPAALVRRAAEALAPGGWLALSGFGPDQFRELRAIGSGAGAPGLCTAGDLAAAARAAGGLRVLAMGEAQQPLWFPAPRDVLAHLRETGVNGRARTGWTRTDLRCFSDSYRARFGTGAGVPLTYHPVWIVARKPG